MVDAAAAVRELLQAPEQGSAASRLRRARQLLLQAGSPAELSERIGLESAALALGQALHQAGLEQAAQACCTFAVGVDLPAATPADALAALNAWVYPRSLRRYQLAILEGQPLQLTLGEQRYRLLDCQADPDRNRLLLEREPDGSLWWLPSGECADGYRLSAADLQPAPAGSERGAEGGAEGGPALPAVVRAGNSNFAHFLWNELDPLLRRLQSGVPLELLQDCDTVLDLSRLQGVQPVEASLLLLRRSVRLGATLVSARARRTLRHALMAETTNALPARRPQPLILLGVRGPGRRELRNEVAFLGALITALSRHFSRPLILLDGFTYQHNNQGQPQAQQREQACSARVQQIIDACPQAQLENLCGLSFGSWLQRSAGVQFYVTHAGTMQHKLGWLHPGLPGLCLVGSEQAAAIADWHRQQCEHAGDLFILPPELFRQEPREPSQSALDDRNQPFEILNIERAVALTLERISATLELPPTTTAASTAADHS